MRLAVVGGGLYGVTTALAAAESGLEVDLYEQAGDILTAASWTNQWRLHRGYHYPRSDITARECLEAAVDFEERFGDAVITNTDQYYCIADDPRTKTTGEEFLAFCESHGLEYELSHPNVVDEGKVDVSIRAVEHRIDPHALKASCWSELLDSSVRIHFGERVSDLSDLPHDYIVVATYSGINRLVDSHEPLQERYKFQLCEKPLVRLPPEFSDTSVVVMDGPFMCFDPYGRTDAFLLGNVVHAVHETTVGTEPTFDATYDAVLDRGLIRAPELTNFQRFVETGVEFIPGLADAEHLGSFYTTRTVLAGVEDTDERPTIVERDGRVFKLFSGKLASSVPAAREILEEIGVREPAL